MEYDKGTVTVSASKIWHGAEWMSLLKQRDLLLLVKAGTRIDPVTLVPIEHKGKTSYEVHLKVGTKDSAETCVLITYKNEPQRWSSINKAIETLSEILPTLDEVIVKVKTE